MAERDEQAENAWSSIREREDSGLMVIVERSQHPLKQ
jgi:hypothetical protein